MPFFQNFKKTTELTGTILQVMKNIAVQKNFLKTHIAPILDEQFRNNDGSLGKPDKDKINRYYGLAVPAILGEAFCTLRGIKMSADERWASTCQGAMTGLFDDFFDKDYMSDDHVEAMLQRNHQDAGIRSNQKLFDLFYGRALEHTANRKLMQDALYEVYKAQIESKKQENGRLEKEELLKITFFKGGSSVVFYRTVFFPEATAKEMELIRNLGSLMQLANDIFDVYKDRESNICTLVTTTKHISEIRSLLMENLRQYHADAFQLPFPGKNIRKFLNILSIGIFSRCLVCLDQLEENERSTGNVFDVKRYSRKQLICDMDRKINMLRSAKKHILEIPV